MSLNRFVYYSAVIGGWSAFLAWMFAEAVFLDSHWLGATAEAVLTGATVGTAVGIGLSLVSGVTGGRPKPRLSMELVAGIFVAAAGGLLGAYVYSGPLRLPRAIGWMVMGLGIGCGAGIYERSAVKIRNGLIGGGVGGFLGGLAFNPIADSGSDLSSRATAFVLLGVAIGALIGLTHVVLRRAWLTVLDGFRPGRQLILTQLVTVLGRGDHLPLPLLGYSGRDLESEHTRIVRHRDGSYTLEDNRTRVGTRLNGQTVTQPAVLSDGDVIRLGSNLIRFNRRYRAPVAAVGQTEPSPTNSRIGVTPPPPPPTGASPSPVSPDPRIPPPPPPRK